MGNRKSLPRCSASHPARLMAFQFKVCLKIMKRIAMAITFAIAFFLGTVFSHPNAWFMRAAETVSPSPGGEGRGEGGLPTKIKLPFRIFRRALKAAAIQRVNETHIFLRGFRL
jgi:hypothetical protein